MSGEVAARPVALVTGASRGIGQALCILLAERGWDVVAGYRRDEAGARATVDAVSDAGGSALAVRADVEEPADIDALFDAAAERFGHLDAFVANAAASAFKPASGLQQHHLDRSFATNTRSFVLAANRAVALMPDRGRIVAVTSYGAQRAFPLYAALGAAKAATEAFVRYLAAEFGPRGVTVNAVNGGLIDTDSLDFYYGIDGIPPMPSVLDRIPLRRAGTAAEMAGAIAFLLSPEAAYITGHVLAVDGGLTVVAPPFWTETTGDLRRTVFGD